MLIYPLPRFHHAHIAALLYLIYLTIHPSTHPSVLFLMHSVGSHRQQYTSSETLKHSFKLDVSFLRWNSHTMKCTKPKLYFPGRFDKRTGPALISPRNIYHHSRKFPRASSQSIPAPSPRGKQHSDTFPPQVSFAPCRTSPAWRHKDALFV